MKLCRFRDFSNNTTKSDYTQYHPTKKPKRTTEKEQQNQRYKQTTKKVEQKKDPRDQRAYSYIVR